MESVVIGHWTFTPAANELDAGEVRRRLEHRAARTLELLCRNRGRIVSQEEIIREVWGGRSVSPNSVPVVISALRQALGDDSRNPRLIETLAKRGYRLQPQDNPPEPQPGRRGPPWLTSFALLAAFVFAMLVCVFVWATIAPPKTLILVPKVLNETGSGHYDPLASATDALILTRLQALENVDIVREASREGQTDTVRLDTRLVIWNGKPLVTFAARTADGKLIWANSSTGGEGLIPRDVILLVKQFERAIDKRNRP